MSACGDLKSRLGDGGGGLRGLPMFLVKKKLGS